MKKNEVEDSEASFKELEEALQKSEGICRDILEHTNDMVWILDTAGNFTFFNKRSEEITGYKFKDFKGKSFAPLIQKEDLPRIIDVFKKTLQGQSPQYEVSIFSKDGRLLTLLVNTTPLFSKGTIIGTVSFGKDITERKTIEKQLQEKVEDLEKMNKLMIGRELKMAELKEEIADLKKQKKV